MRKKEASLSDLYIKSSEEFYGEMYNFGEGYDTSPDDMEEECPEWIQEQLDEEIPF
jgi:hypothetical protein